MLAIHFAGKLIEPIRARCQLDARVASKTDHRQAVARIHFAVQLFDGFQLIFPRAGGH